MCVVVVLIFVSSALCCAPSHACMYFVLLSAIFVMCICVPPPLSGFSCHLRALIDQVTVGRPHVGFHLLIGVSSALVRAFILRSRTHYSFIPSPSDYTFVCWHVCLSNR
jgi:hypothetical protein